jgi:hypothetical protein
MRLITEVARGLNGPARTSVMAGIGGGFTGEFLKSPRLTYSEIDGRGGDPFPHASVTSAPINGYVPSQIVPLHAGSAIQPAKASLSGGAP